MTREFREGFNLVDLDRIVRLYGDTSVDEKLKAADPDEARRGCLL
ncbi:MAG TPA: hypothetical protein VMT95_01905 [Candidatus Binatia bacterium]|nr:hypothetical protein [Candidatus Binatia bacterium]